MFCTIDSRYEVYEDGRIYSHVWKRFIKGSVANNGYIRVIIKGKKYPLHRLIALAFILNSKNKPFVNHKDGNRLNNCKDNLEWCTAKENIQHAWRTGLAKGRYGKRNAMCKLSDTQVFEIRELLKEGKLSQRSIGNIYNVGQSIISAIKLNQKRRIISE